MFSDNVPAASSGFCKQDIVSPTKSFDNKYPRQNKNSRIQRQPFLRLFLRVALRTDSGRNMGWRVSSCRWKDGRRAKRVLLRFEFGGGLEGSPKRPS